MAAVLPLPIPEPVPRRRISIENPRTFLIALSRRQWCELPHELITRETFVLDGPLLVFAENDLPRVAELEGNIEFAHALYRRAYDGAIRAHQANVVRKKHIELVNLALGYTWPGNPPGHIEFAPDA